MILATKFERILQNVKNIHKSQKYANMHKICKIHKFHPLWHLFIKKKRHCFNIDLFKLQ